MITKETIDRIFEAAQVEEIVGDFVTLKKRGANYIGLCPFHDEKTPSFNVSPARGIYKCFGCGKGGNAVNFLMEHEHYSYPEALRFLAKRYSIEVEEERQSPEQEQARDERESLYVVSSFAQKYFTDVLHNEEEGKAVCLTYLRERGFSDAIIARFELGYAPEVWDGFTKKALEAGYDMAYLEKTGLTITAEGKDPHDRFRGRVMFPIRNLSGRVIGFGGRTLKSDKKTPKYVNSPESDIYHKSDVLYGIFESKKAIVAEDNCCLVEGYTDVISLHQAGVENVVASSGTSLTEGQIRLIRRYTPNVTILYDGDAAGIKASFRGIDLILEEGLNVKVVLFPDGEDPDSYARKQGGDELKTFVAGNAKDFITFKTGLLWKDAEGDPVKKAGLIREIVQSVALIPDAIKRSVYLKDCSTLLHVPEQALVTELNKVRRKRYSGRDVADVIPIAEGQQYREDQEDPVVDTTEYQERDLVRIMLQYGSRGLVFDNPDYDPEQSGEEQVPETLTLPAAAFIIQELANDSVALVDPGCRRIFEEYAAAVQGGAVPDERHFLHHPDAEISRLAIEICSSPHVLSDNWEKRGIIVEREDLVLKRSVLNAIYALKSKCVMEMIHTNQLRLKEAESEEVILELMQTQRLLEEAKKQISSQLGRIVLK